MKKLTCKDVGGPCDMEIMCNSFEELGKNCHNHVMEKINEGDELHKTAADRMKNASPEEQKSMMVEFKKRYDESPTL